MDELKIVKLAELRSKIGGIPVKLLVTFLIAGGMYWGFSFEKFKENPGVNIFAFVVTYGIISYFWLCVKMTRNWIVGIVVAVVLIFVWVGSMEKLSGFTQTLIGCAICFGGPVLDLLTVIRYFIIKKKVFSIPGDAYGNGSEAYQEQWQESTGQQEQQTQQTQPRPEEQEQGKGIAHNLLGFLRLPPAPVDGAQRGAPHTAQVGKAHQNGNDRQTQAQPRQGQVPRQPAQIHAVHDVI